MPAKIKRRPGRPAKKVLPIGEAVLVQINSEGGLPLPAVVERNNPALVVVITEADPIWHGARLNERECRVVRSLERKSA